MPAEELDAVVLAGGRISGPYAEATGETVKALVRVAGVSCLDRVLRALRDAPAIGRICVVGPGLLREQLPADVIWRAETPTAYGNVAAGLQELGETRDERVLLCGSDLPDLTGAGIQDFIDRAPAEADFALPVVRREDFLAAYPESANIYVKLAEGRFTGGSQYVIRPRTLLENAPILDELFRQRKSQIGMARTFGLGFILRLITGRLTIARLEKRASELTHSRCRAVTNCAPQIAYDIDNLADFRHIDKVLNNSGS